MATPPSVKRRRQGVSPFDHNDELPIDPMLQIDPALNSEYPPLDDDTDRSTNAYYGRSLYGGTDKQDRRSGDAVVANKRSPLKGSRAYLANSTRQNYTSRPPAPISADNALYSNEYQYEEQTASNFRRSPQKSSERRRESHSDRLPSQKIRHQMANVKQRRHAEGPKGPRETDRTGRLKHGMSDRNTHNEHGDDAQDEASSDSDGDESDARPPTRKTQKFHPIFATYGYGLDPQDPRLRMFWPGTNMPFAMNGQPGRPPTLPPNAFAGFNPMQMAQMNGQGPWMVPHGAPLGMYPGAFPMPHPHAIPSSVDTANGNDTSRWHSPWASHPKRRDGKNTLRANPPRPSLFMNKKRNQRTVSDEQEELDVEESGYNDSFEDLDTESEVPSEVPVEEQYIPRRQDGGRYRLILPKPPAPGTTNAIFHPNGFGLMPLVNAASVSEPPYPPEDTQSGEPVKRKRGRPRGSKTKKRRDDDDPAPPRKKKNKTKPKSEAELQPEDESAQADGAQELPDEKPDIQEPPKPIKDEAAEQADLHEGELLAAFFADEDTDEFEEDLGSSKRRYEDKNTAKIDTGIAKKDDESRSSAEVDADGQSDSDIGPSKPAKPIPKHCSKDNALSAAQRLTAMQKQAKLEAMREEYEATFALSDDEAPAPLKPFSWAAIRGQTGAAVAAAVSKAPETQSQVEAEAAAPVSSQGQPINDAMPESTCPDSLDEPFTQSSQHIEPVGSLPDPITTLPSQPLVDKPSNTEEATGLSVIVDSDAFADEFPELPPDFEPSSYATPEGNLQPEEPEISTTADDGHWLPSADMVESEQTTLNEDVSIGQEEPQRPEIATAPISLDLPKTSPAVQETRTPKSARRPLPSSPLRFQYRASDGGSSSARARQSPAHRSSPLKQVDIASAVAADAETMSSPSVKRVAPAAPPVSRINVMDEEFETDLAELDVSTPRKDQSSTYVLSPKLLSRTKTSASSLSRRRSLQPSSSKRHSLLSLFEEDDDDDDWATSRPKSKPVRPHKHHEHDARRSSNRPAKAGMEKYKQSERSQKDAARKVHRAPSRKSLPASQRCGTDGYSCGKEFCFTCL